MGLVIAIVIIFVIVMFPDVIAIGLAIIALFLEFILRLFGKSFNDKKEKDKK